MSEPAVPVVASGAPALLWDLPVRLVHWSLAALLPALWWSAESGRLDLHLKFGLVMLGLVAFRLLWGVFGSTTARFGQFLRGPRAVMAYARGLRGAAGTAPAIIGHNPLGGWSVVALLGLLAAQVTLGLFAQDTDALYSGPLNSLVSWDTAKIAGEVHEVLFNVILALVVLHLAAIAWYRFARRDDLVTPMITGRKSLAPGSAPPRRAPAWRALAAGAVAAALAVWIAWSAPPIGAPFPWDKRAAEASFDAGSYM